MADSGCELLQLPYEKIVKRWNDFAAHHGFAAIRPKLVNKKRYKKLCERWAEWQQHADGDGFRTLDDLLGMIKDSPFLRGKSWFDFWWLLAGDKNGNDNWQKVLGGNYRGEDGDKVQQKQEYGGPWPTEAKT